MMLYEISRKTININKYEEPCVCWENSVLTVRCNKQLHLFQFSYNLNSIEKEIDLKQCTVSCETTSPIPHNYLKDYVSRGVRNSELVEMFTNSAFWPHNKLLMHELTNIVEYQWSPFHQKSENDCLLAAVNSVGNVEFFGSLRHSWCSVMDFSSLIKTHLNENNDKLTRNPNHFEEVKETVYLLQTASICWATKLRRDNSSFFVTAQKSGDVLFWSVKYNLGNLETEFCGGIYANDIEISHMFWISKEENKVLLICSGESGEVISYLCLIEDKYVTLLKKQFIWNYKDKMVSKYLKHLFVNDKLILLFNKHRHLVVQMFDKDFEMLFQNVQNVNDNKITSVTQNKDAFYLTTVDTKLYRIDYSIIEDTIDVSFINIELKGPEPTYKLYGVAVSANRAIFALVMINRKLMLKRQTINIEIFLFSPSCDKELDYIINHNLSKKLINVWDLIEVFRCKTMKSRTLPKIDYDHLLNNENDYYLKIYLVILKLYKNLEKCMALYLKDGLPETSLQVVKDKILVIQAIRQIKNICSRNLKTNPMSIFDYECIMSSKIFVDYYCKTYDKKLTITEDFCNFPNVKFERMCQWCDEKLVEFSCKNNHLNMFCSLTFTLIEGDYLVCKSCNAIARIELFSEKPTCLFCDLYLVKA